MSPKRSAISSAPGWLISAPCEAPNLPQNMSRRQDSAHPFCLSILDSKRHIKPQAYQCCSGPRLLKCAALPRLPTLLFSALLGRGLGCCFRKVLISLSSLSCFPPVVCAHFCIAYLLQIDSSQHAPNSTVSSGRGDSTRSEPSASSAKSKAVVRCFCKKSMYEYHWSIEPNSSFSREFD